MDGLKDFTFGIIAGMLVMGLALFESVYDSGAIAAHKGEIVCVNIPFKEDRWECGEP
ncbi:hypothetical protein [Zhongshania sp.]|uniref:hypothetical protein n=1 Tax=Zhongshania sp. TaxID=1971902 RepID=UPI003561D68D